MNLVESILTKNPCYTAGKTITVKGLMQLSKQSRVYKETAAERHDTGVFI